MFNYGNLVLSIDIDVDTKLLLVSPKRRSQVVGAICPNQFRLEVGKIAWDVAGESGNTVIDSDFGVVNRQSFGRLVKNLVGPVYAARHLADKVLLALGVLAEIVDEAVRHVSHVAERRSLPIRM